MDGANKMLYDESNNNETDKSVEELSSTSYSSKMLSDKINKSLQEFSPRSRKKFAEKDANMLMKKMPNMMMKLY